MEIGAEFPQKELAHDPGALRVWGQAVEQTGFAHAIFADHVLGADPIAHAPWTGPYDVTTRFHDTFVALGYLAGITTTLKLVVGVLVLPQRQTVLVAKQAAEVDLLSGGRLRLGVGIGWNRVEYDGLGKDFTNRGRRCEEQIVLLRWLWTEQSVTFEGRYEQVVGAGIAPLPVQRPIPLWYGGSSPKAFDRIGRLADGWFPMPDQDLDEARRIIEMSALAAGRDPAAIGMEGRAHYTGDVDQLAETIERWRDVGATHVLVNTMRAGLKGVDEHVAVLSEVARALGLSSRSKEIA